MINHDVPTDDSIRIPSVESYTGVYSYGEWCWCCMMWMMTRDHLLAAVVVVAVVRTPTRRVDIGHCPNATSYHSGVKMIAAVVAVCGALLLDGGAVAMIVL